MAQIRRFWQELRNATMERPGFSTHRILLLGGKAHSIILLRSILGALGITRIHPCP